MTLLRVVLALVVPLLAACNSSLPTPSDMDRFYREAEIRAQRDMDRLAQRRDRGEISEEEYKRRAADITDSIPRRASDMAWTRHELVQSERRGTGIPTPDSPAQISAPGRGAGSGSFYRQAGQSGPGYQGSSQGLPGGYQQGVLTPQADLRN